MSNLHIRERTLNMKNTRKQSKVNEESVQGDEKSFEQIGYH